jgi:hypothetical protein
MKADIGVISGKRSASDPKRPVAKSMKMTNWKDTAELIGIAAIVASLIFVGLQMKQTQEIALSAAYQSRADSSLHIRAMPLESPELLSAITKLRLPTRSDLTGEELTALQFFFRE